MIPAPQTSEGSLAIRGLRVSLTTDTGKKLPALTDIDLTLDAGQAVGLVGESGSGKTLLALSVLQLLPDRARIDAGTITLGGVELLTLDDKGMQAIRGRSIGMVFQEPAAALCPLTTIGSQVEEAIALHSTMPRAERKLQADILLRRVGLVDAPRILAAYPDELSGGQRQRCLIAIAISASPSFLLADEPTTSLDATVQADILRLVSHIQEERRMGLLLITHDLAVVAEHCDRIAVMYGGTIVEQGPTRDVLGAPRHPYTRALLGSSLSRSAPFRTMGEPSYRIPTIPGAPPALDELPGGCRFASRCPLVRQACHRELPPLRAMVGERTLRCVDESQ